MIPRDGQQKPRPARSFTTNLCRRSDQTFGRRYGRARAFSDQEAYSDRRFPITEPVSVCVLFQQELTSVAADRLNRFEAFVRDDSQQRAEAARAAYDEALTTFKDTGFSLIELANIVATVRDELRQDALALDVRNAVLRALWRHRQIRRRHANLVAAFDAPVVTYPPDPARPARGEAGDLRRSRGHQGGCVRSALLHLAALPRPLHEDRAGTRRQDPAPGVSAFVGTAFAQDDEVAAKAQWFRWPISCGPACPQARRLHGPGRDRRAGLHVLPQEAPAPSCTPTIPSSGLTARSSAEPRWSASSPTNLPSSGWSAPSCSNRTTSGPSSGHAT